MNWHQYILYVLTEAALSLAPGPAVWFVIAHGLSGLMRRPLAATLGILSANALYFAVSATGLGSIILHAYGFFVVVKWVGAAYLAYLGLAALLGRASPLSVAGAADAPCPQVYGSAMTLQLANPKALLLFVAILPQFIDVAAPVQGQMLWLAAGSIVPEFFILCGYGYLAARARRIAGQPHFAQWLDRLSGSLILAIAAMVARAART